MPGNAVDMWRPLGCADSERFALVWESEELKALNNTLYSFVKNKVSFLVPTGPSTEGQALATDCVVRREEPKRQANVIAMHESLKWTMISFWP